MFSIEFSRNVRFILIHVSLISTNVNPLDVDVVIRNPAPQ